MKKATVLMLFASAVGCGKKLAGPTPIVSGVAPPAVCQAQIKTAVTLSGSGLSPLVTGALATKQLELPRVSLVRVKDVAGTATSAEPLIIPDDPKAPDASHVRWASMEMMSFDVYPDLKLPTGLYDIEVANANGRKGAFPASLLAVPPPSVSAIVPDILCGHKDNTVEISGDFFIKSKTVATTQPKVRMGEKTFDPASLDDCRDLPGTAGLQACKKLTVMLPATALADGVHLIVVENPAPVGCASLDVIKLTIVPEPTLVAIEPDLVCTAEGDNSVTMTGTGFLSIDGVMPKLRLGNMAKSVILETKTSNCQMVEGPLEMVQTCTTVTAVLPKDGLPPGLFESVVTNPAPADCHTEQKVNFLVVPEPAITLVKPDLGCAADGAVMVNIEGTGFLTVDNRVPEVTVGMLKLIPTPSLCVDVAGPREKVRACSVLTVTVPKDTMAATALPVVVKNPATAGCSTKQKATYTLVPAPTIASVEPDLGCAAEGPVSVTIKGTGFITIGTQVPEVTVGMVKVVPIATLCTPVMGPAGDVKTCTQLTVALPKDTALGVVPVVVRNPAPAACVSKEARSFTVLGAPVVTAIRPDMVCAADGAVAVTLEGMGFLSIDGKAPEVSIGMLKVMAMPVMPTCTKVVGPLGNVLACTQLAISLPRGTPPSAAMVTVKNPAPAACTSAPRPFTIVDRPVISQVMPGAVCGQTAEVTVTLVGTGFVTIGTALPLVKVGTQTYISPTASGCAPLMGGPLTAQLCTSLAVKVPANTFASGQHAVSVTNPMPAGCGSTGTTVFEVTSPPVLTSVAPTTVCAGAASITLTGTGFGVNADVTINMVKATKVTVAVDGKTAVAAFAAGLPTGGPFPVTIANAVGCAATMLAQVTVVPGPQVFFVDPAVAYNGITIQATVYGTGFTGTVQSIALKPTTGGAAIPVVHTFDPLRPGQAQIVIPKGTAPGDYDLELKDTTACAATLAKGLTITDQTTLALGTTPVSPAFAWQSTSSATTISADAAGTGFAAVPRVYFNPVTPGPSTVAAALGAVTFVDRNTATALVTGLPVGKYDVIVVNPDGKVGVAVAGFEVTAAAPPAIDTLTPGSVSNRNPEVFVISGTEFRMPLVTLNCLDATGAPLSTSPVATVTASTDKTVNVSFDASTGGVACVVRVTNNDNKTYVDHAALVITNPSQNLYAAKAGPDLSVGRRGPVALPANASSAARYLHVMGGDAGNGAAFDTVESSALSLLGVPSPFFVQRNRLKQGRALAGGALIGRFVYVLGGTSGTAPLASVERAAILDPKTRGEVTELALELDDTNGLGAGIWYYRVAAVLNNSDAFNPGGESLASDPFPVRLPAIAGRKFQATIKWKADPKATKYRVYRSVMAGAVVGTEQVIAEVTAPATTFKDTGAVPINTDTPLPLGSLGQWQTVGAALSVPREGLGVATASDPGDATTTYLYAIGGRQNPTTALATYELLNVKVNADGSQTPGGAFVAGANALATARWQLGASRAGHDNSARIAAGTDYIYALAGVAANGTTIVSDVDAAVVQAGGQLDSWQGLRMTNTAGYTAIVAGDFVFAFGGSNAGPDAKVTSGEICGPGVGGCGPMAMQKPPNLTNWNAGQNMLVPRYLMGGALSGAFIYMAAGVTASGPPAVVTRSTEYRLW